MRNPYVVRRQVENTFLVRQRDRRLRFELVGVLVAVALVGGGLLAYTSIHVETVRSGYRVDELERELHRLEQQERHLRLEITRMTSPERVAERASELLEMRPPSLEQTVFFAEAAGSDAEPWEGTR